MLRIVFAPAVRAEIFVDAPEDIDAGSLTTAKQRDEITLSYVYPCRVTLSHRNPDAKAAAQAVNQCRQLKPFDQPSCWRPLGQSLRMRLRLPIAIRSDSSLS